MPQLTRRLITVRLPIEMGAFIDLLRPVVDAYPLAKLDTSGDEVHVVITETVDDDDPRLIDLGRIEARQR